MTFEPHLAVRRASRGPGAGLHSAWRDRSARTAWEINVADGIKLNGHHRVTVEKIFQHPVSHNIQWHDVLSLLRTCGRGDRRARRSVQGDPGG